MALPESVALKIIRAKEHLDIYRSELDRNLNARPDELVVDFDFQNDPYVKLAGDVLLPARFSLILGDCLQNLRTSLDYLVWELVLAAKRKPSAKNMFPICTESNLFEQAVSRGRLNNVPPGAVAEIEMLQPYYGGQSHRGHPFWVLDTLCNINKHRRILLTRMKAGYKGHVPGTDKHTQIVGDIGSLRGPHNVGMQVELVAFVAFEEGGITQGAEVISLVSQCIDSVEHRESVCTLHASILRQNSGCAKAFIPNFSQPWRFPKSSFKSAIEI